MSTSKIRIKLGAIEVEYEGSEAFLKEELPALLSAVSELHQKAGASITRSELTSLPAEAPTEAQQGQGTAIQMTTAAIASRLQAKSGSELVMAAAAHLSLAQGLKTFSRKRLTEEMKSATSVYRETYVSNLSKSLRTLLKDNKLNEPSRDVYALTHAAEQELRNRLA